MRSALGIMLLLLTSSVALAEERVAPVEAAPVEAAPVEAAPADEVKVAERAPPKQRVVSTGRCSSGCTLIVTY